MKLKNKIICYPYLHQQAEIQIYHLKFTLKSSKMTMLWQMSTKYPLMK